jgi:hypothetical protein
MNRMRAFVRRLRPRFADPAAFAIVAAAVALAVFILAWHGRSLRLEVDGASLGWIVLVAFGMTWHGEWESGWRIGGGLALGAFAGVAGYYGSLSVLPVTPFVFGLSMGVVAGCVALLCHAFPRFVAFSGGIVGFGIGIAAVREFGFKPTTRVDDLFALMLTIALALALGVLGSMALRAFIVRTSLRRPDEGRLLHLPRRTRRVDTPAERSAAR